MKSVSQKDSLELLSRAAPRFTYMTLHGWQTVLSFTAYAFVSLHFAFF